MRQNIAFDLNVVAFTHQDVLPIAMDMVVDDAHHRRSSVDTGSVVEADFVVTNRPSHTVRALNVAGLSGRSIFLDDKP